MGELELDQLARLLYLLVGLTLLVFIILIVYVVVAGRRARAKQALRQQEQAGDLVIRPALQVTGEVLSLVREVQGGPLQVEVAGTRYRTLAEVTDPQVKRRVLDAAIEFIQFTGVLGAGTMRPAPLEKTHRWREDLRQGSQADLERVRVAASEAAPQPPAPTEVEQQFLSLLAELGQAPPPPEKPSLIGSIQRRLHPPPTEQGQARSFIDDIDAIVQRRVQMIPALAGRGLHVRPGPGGKVVFQFEGEQYSSLDDLPNLTARQLVQDAIQEWDETT